MEPLQIFRYNKKVFQCFQTNRKSLAFSVFKDVENVWKLPNFTKVKHFAKFSRILKKFASHQSFQLYQRQARI